MTANPIRIVFSTMLLEVFSLCLFPNASGGVFSNVFLILLRWVLFPKGSRTTYTGSFFSTSFFFFCLAIGWHWTGKFSSSLIPCFEPCKIKSFGLNDHLLEFGVFLTSVSDLFFMGLFFFLFSRNFSLLRFLSKSITV